MKKKKKKNTVRTVHDPIENRGRIYTPNTQILDRSLLWLSTGTSIKNDGVKIVLWAQGTIYSWTLFFYIF